MKKVQTNKLYIKILTFLFLTICIAFFPAAAQAEGGVAVTGGFDAYQYYIVQGQSLESPLINLHIINYYDKEITLKLYPTAPEGITIKFESDIITLDANSDVNVPVSISVEAGVGAAEYPLVINYTVLSGNTDTSYSGAEYSLETKLTVSNEYAQVNIDTADFLGEHVDCSLYLYREDINGNKSPAGFSSSGTINATVVPGTYRVIALIDNYTVGEDAFEISHNIQYQSVIKAQTVQINNYKILPVLTEDNNHSPDYVNLSFALNNVHKNLGDGKVSLSVYKDGILFEEKDIFTFDALNNASHDLYYDYSPAEGWEKSLYTFQLKYVDNSSATVIAQSEEIDFNAGAFYPASKNILPEVLLGVLIITVLAGLFVVTKYLLDNIRDDEETDDENSSDEILPLEDGETVNLIEAETSMEAEETDAEPTDGTEDIPPVQAVCTECGGEETFPCPVCGGTGSTLYQNVKEECIYCSGLGEVLCPKCVDRRTLMTCLKCNGNGYVMEEKKKVECTHCNGFGYVVDRHFAVFKNGVKMKLGKREK